LLDAPMYFASTWGSEERERVYEGWLAEGAWAKVLRTLSPAQVAPPIQAGLERLHQLEVEPLEVVIAGEFNAGKSSLVNALAGAELARVGVTPTTHRAAAYAWKGLRLVDTPGFNAPGHADGDEAFAALAGAHAALWVMDGTLPFRDSEARRLAALQRAGVPFWLVVNKCDRVPPSEVALLSTYIGQALTDAGLEPVEAPFFVSTRKEASLEPFSARLASWFVQHETALREAACLRMLRRFVERAEVPSTAQRGRARPNGERALWQAPAEQRLAACLRTLERAENCLKR
jgi:small GTP-binding protein